LRGADEPDAELAITDLDQYQRALGELAGEQRDDVEADAFASSETSSKCRLRLPGEQDSPGKGEVAFD
jgi:hypothetical protein